MHRPISISSVFLGLLIFGAYGEEILIQFLVKKPINIVSDRYVSFAIEPSHLLELCSAPSNKTNVTTLTQKLGSSYLKIGGTTTNMFTLDDDSIPFVENQVRISPSDWLALHQWLNTTNLTPVVTLPYAPKTKQWSLRSLISMLSVTNALGIRNGLWQLGTDVNLTDMLSYVDDLATFGTIIDVFRKNGNNWGIIGADMDVSYKPDDVELYVRLSKHLVQANAWTQPIVPDSQESNDNKFFERDPALRYLLSSKSPVFLNVPQSYQSKNSEICDNICEYNGLRWAETLGTSAQNGFNVVFQSINRNDLVNPSLSYFVSLLHKKIMGPTVFDTKILNAGNKSPRYYTHCTKNLSRSFAVMGVNFGDVKSKVSTNMSNKQSGLEVYQYILTVDHGTVLINGVRAEVDSDLKPVIKIKRQSRPTSFTLPPRSIGFWVFPQAQIKQCKYSTEQSFESTIEESSSSSKTSTENLLIELINEVIEVASETTNNTRPKRHAIVKKDSKHMNRMKRNTDPGRRVPRQLNNDGLSKLFKFQFPANKKFQKFWNTPRTDENKVKLSSAAIPPVVSTIHDVYRVEPSENAFKSVENTELPSGDVFFHVGEEQNTDYVAFDETKADSKKEFQLKMNNQKFGDFEDIEESPSGPAQMYEFHPDARESKPTAADIPPYSELWESDVYQRAAPIETEDRRSQLDQIPKQKVRNIDLIVKELPPTYRQNQENLLRARNTLSTFYVNEGDKMSTLNLNMPLRPHDLDDDGFFVSKRKRRSIDTSFNDVIERRVKDMKKSEDYTDEIEEYAEFLTQNDNRMSLLEKVTNIINSLEKMDEIGKYSSIDKLTADVKDLETFLFRGTSKILALKPKKVKKDIRRKCKILSTNFEQQCLRENDFITNRVKTRVTDQKKKSSLKKGFAKNKLEKLNRSRRNAVWQNSSWETDRRRNMILKEVYAAEGNYNRVVPSTSARRPVYLDYQPNEDKKPYTQQIYLLQNLKPYNNPSIVKELTERPTIARQTTEQPTADPIVPMPIDPSTIEEQLIESLDENEQLQPQDSPKFIEKISHNVENLMNIVEKHVSGWWNLLS